ncbi:MAG: 4Fe-4S dicluster domain-containing protein [Chloroflexota bacterium]
MTKTSIKSPHPEKYLIADMDKCTGCEACSLACSFIKFREFNPSYACIRILKFEESGVDAPVACQQCEEPRCVEACPRDALVVKPETGILFIDKEACDGCGACAVACTYGAISIHPKSPKKNRVILKCDLCGGDPECIKWCETKAIEFVDASERERIDKARENLLMARKRFEIEHLTPLWKY